MDSGLVVPTFQQGDDLIDCINKAKAFLLAMASRFPPSNNQLRMYSNLRNQATIQDGRVIVQQVQRRQTQREGHMAKQCTQPTRLRNSAWFKEKLMLVKAQEASQILDEEQITFIADPGIEEAMVAQQTILKNSAFQTEVLNAYDSDCDDISSAKAVLMENLSSCDLDDTNSSAPNDLLVLSLVEQMTDHVANLDKENQTNKIVNESLTAELERYKERVAIFEQRQNVDLNKCKKLIDSQMDDLIRNRNAKLAAFQQEIDTLKQTLSTHVKEKESLSTTLIVLKTESNEKESKYIDKEIVLENQNKELENIICKLYRSSQAMHMLVKLQVFYDDTHKQALEQAFWLKHSTISETPVTSHTPVRIKAPSELPKLSLVNENHKKLKYHLASFDKVVKKRTTSDAITAEKNDLEIQIKQLSIDNDQLLNQIMSQEIMHIVVNSVDILDMSNSFVDECNKCPDLET
ncbi:hypothetical protein Tco_1549165 [Tanacetum coccineum]